MARAEQLIGGSSNENKQKMVTKSQIEACLARVELINYGETLSIFGAASIQPRSLKFSYYFFFNFPKLFFGDPKLARSEWLLYWLLHMGD